MTTLSSTKASYVDQTLRRSVGQLLSAHQTRPQAVMGEVMALWRGPREQHFVLRDGYKASGLAASLPSSYQLKNGDMVRVDGELVCKADRPRGALSLRLEGRRVHIYPSCYRQERLRRRVSELVAHHDAQPMPESPLRRIALVVGLNSLAEKDVLQALPNSLAVDVHRASFRRANEIANAIEAAAATAPGLILVARGGGDRLDFSPFEDEALLAPLARVAATVPLMLALGHASDRFLAEKVVGAHAATPTHAGQLVRDRFYRNARRAREGASSSAPVTLEAATRRRRIDWSRLRDRFRFFAAGVTVGLVIALWLGG